MTNPLSPAHPNMPYYTATQLLDEEFGEMANDYMLRLVRYEGSNPVGIQVRRVVHKLSLSMDQTAHRVTAEQLKMLLDSVNRFGDQGWTLLEKVLDEFNGSPRSARWHISESYELRVTVDGCDASVVETLTDLFRYGGVGIAWTGSSANATVIDRMPLKVEHFKQQLQRLIDQARTQGVVLRIEQLPTQPLRMGGYDLVADAYPARVMAEPIERSNSDG